MQVERYPSASAFLVAVGDFLLESETENAVILGVAHTLADASQASGPAPYFAAVHADGGPVAAAFSNLPRKLGVTQAARHDAIALLVEDARAACPELRDIGGPEPAAGLFAAEFAAQTGRRVVSRAGTRIHQLDSVRAAARVPPGRLRAAVAGDAPHLVPWVDTFHRDVGGEGDATQIVQERIRLGQLFVWDDSGPVSMAAWNGKTPNGVRVSMVFTPETLRGRGYASATVAALSQWLLDHGNRFCCLYTDVTNPISNAIYARIGYRPVCEAGMYTFATSLLPGGAS